MNRRNVSNTVNIAGNWIGDSNPCFIIAEAGSNHNGSLQQAMSLIDAAVDAGVDAVKFQLHRAAKVYLKSAGQSDYLKSDRSIYDIVADMEMPYEWLPELVAYCRSKNIIFLSSVFDEESVEWLDPHVPAYKIASYEMTHLPLVRYVAGKGKPVIISTGTATLEEVAETVEAFYETGNQDLLLMQCTASYPAPLESLNLRAISTMKNAFGMPVGFSDHSREPLVGPLAAVALGADLVEKHFTLSNRLPGPDHSYALEPEELRSLVQKVREVERTFGNGEKTVQPVEAELRAFARRSIFATQDIKAGDALSPKNVAVLRCGKLAPGLEPKDYDQMLGSIATGNIKADSAIRKGDYA